MTILVVKFKTEYMGSEEEYKYFEDSDWGFDEALKWCEFQLPFDQSHTPAYWKKYQTFFTKEQVEKWKKEFKESGQVWMFGFQYSTSFMIYREEVISQGGKI